VLHDRGLPSLSIVDVTPREIPGGAGRDGGWLTAVTVHNAGAAEVEVPLVIRSGTSSITKSIRVAGNSNATERVVTAAMPTEVVVNDGSVPEAGASEHTLKVVAKQG
jgi:outer membrane protein assembly factor BamA